MKLNGYKKVKVGKITQAKLKRALKGGSLTLSAAEVGGDDHELLLHPSNAKLFEKAEKAKKGVRLNVARGEIDYDQKAHADGDLAGGSIWSWLKEKAWPAVKTVLGGVGDAIAYTNPELAPLREGVRSLTGVGVSAGGGKKPVKGSAEAKAHMAELRSKRKQLKGASFIL
ncbi:hypothetical protein DYB28_000612 [Aphanomyces astaci]|uniref:Uncharacterized protein n=1 Tax=Aphanomyces astaci TaxID=112090 RepID=A0A9X8H2N0_APHAT|nr:hypothetical protein DYB28_000612 [Aphanomyces astaci]